MAVIEVRQLSKQFGAAIAVDRLSFQIETGTVTGFLGPNGAGKTTMLRMLPATQAEVAGSAGGVVTSGSSPSFGYLGRRSSLGCAGVWPVAAGPHDPASVRACLRSRWRRRGVG